MPLQNHSRSRNFRPFWSAIHFGFWLVLVVIVAVVIAAGLLKTFGIDKNVAEESRVRQEQFLDELEFKAYEKGFDAGVSACIKHVKGTNCQLQIEDVRAEDHGPKKR